MQARRALLHKRPPKTNCEEPLKQALKRAAQPCAMKSHTTHNSHWRGASERLPRLARGFQGPGRHKGLIKTHQNSSKLIKTYQNLSKLIKTYQNLSKLIKTHQNSSKLTETQQNLLKDIKTY